jgi:hypothetical protein
MDIGTGIAITGTSFAIAATAINLFKNGKKCVLHDMLVEEIKNMAAWLEKVEAKLDRVIERAIK